MRIKKYLLHLFTIIELIMVIAIILILVSILLPAVNKGKELGKNIKCKNNLKQLSILTINYQGDFNDYFIPLKTGLSTANTGIWGETIHIYSIALKAGNKGIFNCPSNMADVVSEKYSAYGACYYGPMSWILYGGAADQTNWGVSGYPPAKSNLLRIPGRTILFADNAYGDSGYYFIKNVSSYYTNFPGRHLHSDNIVFADGHAEQRISAKLNTWLQRGYTITDIPNHFLYYSQGIVDQK